MLDEECLRPGTVTDETFLEKLNQVCATHQHFESRMSKSSRFLNDTSLPHSCFRIQHYAGKVRGSAPPRGGRASEVAFWPVPTCEEQLSCYDSRSSECSVEVEPGSRGAKSYWELRGKPADFLREFECSLSRFSCCWALSDPLKIDLSTLIKGRVIVKIRRHKRPAYKVLQAQIIYLANIMNS